MWEFIDKAVYINLDHREDRRQIMNNFFEEGKFPENKIYRFSGIKHEVGIVGCAMGHISILEMAKRNKWKSILILEDDLQWIDFENNYKKLENLISSQLWDVCMLTGDYLEVNGSFVKGAFYTNAYIVQSHYYDTLLDNFKVGLQLKLNKKIPLVYPLLSSQQKLQKYNEMVKNDSIHNIDLYWIKLQQKDTWIGIIPQMISQVESYSDIYNSNANHEKNRNDDISYKQSLMNHIKYLIAKNKM